MNATAPVSEVDALPLLPYAIRLFDTLIPPLPSSNSSFTIDYVPGQGVPYPWYRVDRDSLWPSLSDKYLSLAAPIVVYWVYSMVYELIDRLQWPFFEQYRIHEPEEIKARNKVTKFEVVKMVAIQQLIQTILGLIVLEPEEVLHAQVTMSHRNGINLTGEYLQRILIRLVGTQTAFEWLSHYGPQLASWMYWWGLPIAQFWWAFFVMDTWQYFWHRAAHESRFLYRHFHSHHHRLYVPYAFGALYNHPVEGLVLDSLGAVVSYTFSLMTVRQGILLFFFSTLKTVDDHGGYAFPWYIDPLHILFPNTAEYHDIHHQMQGLRYNYSQPFFIHFDVLLGTRMDQNKLNKMRAANAKKPWKSSTNSSNFPTSQSTSTSSTVQAMEKNEDQAHVSSIETASVATSGTASRPNASSVVVSRHARTPSSASQMRNCATGSASTVTAAA